MKKINWVIVIISFLAFIRCSFNKNLTFVCVSGSVCVDDFDKKEIIRLRWYKDKMSF